MLLWKQLANKRSQLPLKIKRRATTALRIGRRRAIPSAPLLCEGVDHDRLTPNSFLAELISAWSQRCTTRHRMDAIKSEATKSQMENFQSPPVSALYGFRFCASSSGLARPGQGDCRLLAHILRTPIIEGVTTICRLLRI